MIIALKDSHPPQTSTPGLLRTQHCTWRLSPISSPRLPGGWTTENPESRRWSHLACLALWSCPPIPRFPEESLPSQSEEKRLFSGSQDGVWVKQGTPQGRGRPTPGLSAAQSPLGWEEKRPPPVEQRASTSGIFHLIPKTVLQVDLILFHHFKDEKIEGYQI